MDRKLDAGALLVGAASLLLAVSLFLDWYGVDGSTSVTAWRAFEVWDLVLLGAAGAAAAAAFGPLDTRALVIAAGVAFVVVVSQLIQAPPAGQGGDLRVGAWLALVAVFGLVGGAALTTAKIAVTVDVQGRERRRRVPAVDRRGEQAETQGAPSADEEPDGEVTAVDRFAREAEDTQATQSFEARSDEERP